MSTTSQVKKIIYRLLEENGECTLEEVKRLAEAEGMVLLPQGSLIRSTMYLIMQNDRSIKRAGRGRYKKENEKYTDIKDDITEYLDETENKLLKILDDLEDFNWYQASDEEIEIMRKRGKRMIKLHEAIGKRGHKMLF